jgi:AraC-like DNA-binding protein
MEMVFSQPRMLNLLKSFHTLTNVRTGFFDLSGKEIFAYPVIRSRYCVIIRATKKGDEACVRCDQSAYQFAAEHDGKNIYQCHAGLTEMVVSVNSPSDERAGYLMIGQFKQAGISEKQHWDGICRKIVTPLRLNLRQLKEAYSQLPIMNTEQINASIHILKALAVQMWQENCIRLQNEPLSKQVEKYITDHLNQQLNLPDLTKKFKVCKTTLCKTIKQDFNLTVNETIRHIRIERAKQLLQTSKKNVSEIAENVGITNYNYFTKVFKEETGITPLAFRKICEEEYRSRNIAI